MPVRLVVLVADQASKWWILNVVHLEDRVSIPLLPVLNLTMVWNQGVTFGMFHQDGAAGPWILGGISLAVVLALAYWLTRAESALVACALGAIAGGAVGNVIDRFRFGAGGSGSATTAPPPQRGGGGGALLLDGLRSKPERLQAPGVGQ